MKAQIIEQYKKELERYASLKMKYVQIVSRLMEEEAKYFNQILATEEAQGQPLPVSRIELMLRYKPEIVELKAQHLKVKAELDISSKLLKFYQDELNSLRCEET